MNNDFRYVMHDMTNLYIGAKHTYDELMDIDEVPFKLKTILSHYMLKEIDEQPYVIRRIASQYFEDGAIKIDEEDSFKVYLLWGESYEGNL